MKMDTYVEVTVDKPRFVPVPIGEVFTLPKPCGNVHARLMDGASEFILRRQLGDGTWHERKVSAESGKREYEINTLGVIAVHLGNEFTLAECRTWDWKDTVRKVECDALNET